MLVADILFSIDNAKFFRTAIPVEAIITDFKRTGSDNSAKTIVKYTAHGKEFWGELGYYSTAMRYGDSVTVCYNPYNPLDIRTKSSGTLSSVIFFSLGILFLSISIGYGAYLSRKRKRIQWLKRNGLRQEPQEKLLNY